RVGHRADRQCVSRVGHRADRQCVNRPMVNGLCGQNKFTLNGWMYGWMDGCPRNSCETHAYTGFHLTDIQSMSSLQR
ncbi:MAG: hypothetical protein PF482_03810, partial [Desulfobacteraceae bacterium]|nr:hypothetical protein [Desulfobacteraceae bacterium]